MTEKPVLFSGPMVKAILDGRKTMTRRVLKPQPPSEATSAGNYSSSREGVTNCWSWMSGDPKDCDTWEILGDFKLPYTPGDLLWVRESGWEAPDLSERELREGADTWSKYAYDADDEWEPDWLKGAGYKRRPSIFMPRWASRISLRVTAVKVERLQSISEDDAIAEGAEAFRVMTADHDLTAPSFIEGFRGLWDSINGEGAWDANPWVAAYSFERVKP